MHMRTVVNQNISPTFNNVSDQSTKAVWVVSLTQGSIQEYRYISTLVRPIRYTMDLQNAYFRQRVTNIELYNLTKNRVCATFYWSKEYLVNLEVHKLTDMYFNYQ